MCQVLVLIHFRVSLVHDEEWVWSQHEVLPQGAVEGARFADGVHQHVVTPTDNQAMPRHACLAKRLSHTSAIIMEYSPMNLIVRARKCRKIQ